MHPSAWNRNSTNFAFWEFSEVRGFVGALSYLVPWRTYTPLRQEYAAFVTQRGGGLTPFFLRPSTERRSLYETHHSVVGHHGPNPFGGKRGRTGGGGRLRRSAKLGRWAGRVHPEGRKRCPYGRHYRRARRTPRGCGDPQGRHQAARRRRRRDQTSRQGRLALRT